MTATPPTNPTPAHAEPIDPRLDALLDVALSPDAASEGWSVEARDRTLAAMREASRAAGEPAVAGRIGPNSAGLRFGVGLAAAAVLTLAGAVVAITLMSDPTGTPPPSGSDILVQNPPTLGPDESLPDADDAFASLDARLADELDAWAAAARATGLSAGLTDDTTLAIASADWWNADPTADAYNTGPDADALRDELDAFLRSPDLVF